MEKVRIEISVADNGFVVEDYYDNTNVQVALNEEGLSASILSVMNNNLEKKEVEKKLKQSTKTSEIAK